MRALGRRLEQYKPGPEALLFGLSVLGLLDILHLYIQKGQGFEEGCFGLSSLSAEQSVFDCATVTAGPAADFLGVSNLVWGTAFYGVVALLTVLVFWARPRIRGWIHGGRIGVLAAGVAYSSYLVYLQTGPIGAFCALCLVSSAIVTLLFGIQVATLTSYFSLADTPMPTRLVKRQIATFVYIVVAGLVLVGADLTYFDAWDGTPGPGPAASSGASDTGVSQQCRLDTSKEPLQDDGASMVTFQDITKGSSDADVTVIEYFDPNCPHCKDFHSVMKKVVAEYGDEIRVVYKPFALGRSSVPEIQALYVAHQSGKFSEMLEAQYARQGPGGINRSDLQVIAQEIGMDAEVLTGRIDGGDFRNYVVQVRKRAQSIGVDSTPTVLVNGHFLRNRSFACMKEFIAEAQEGTLSSSTSR